MTKKSGKGVRSLEQARGYTLPASSRLNPPENFLAKENEWIRFEMIEQKPKTQVWEVFNKQTNFSIGIIKWYPSWRHYCFFPTENTVFSDRCLLSIGTFVDKLNNDYKSKKEN